MSRIRASTRHRAPPWGGFRTEDLAHAVAAAMTLVWREQPIIGVITTNSPTRKPETHDGEKTNS